jgi:quercetin dioxygenase-like cupin family protein
MAITHAQSGEVIDVRPFACNLEREATRTLVKTDTLEVIRLVMHSGKVYEGHKVPGEITIQCLEGRCTVTAAGATRDLEPGHLMYLAGGEEHALHALQDASLLLTILLVHKPFGA